VTLEGTALVTGASSGIGRAIAFALARRGMRVVAAGRDRQRLAAVVAALPEPGGLAVAADLSDDEGCTRLAARVEVESATLEVLVHAAGVVHVGPLADATAAQFDDLYRVNLRAPFAVTRALLPRIRAARGQIVFVNSTAGLAPGAGNGLYAATKHALRALTSTLRDEVNTDGVRVLSVFPGCTATAMQDRLAALEGKTFTPEFLLQPDDVAEVVVTALALPRSAEITDVTLRPLRKPRSG
jgi:NADP-dependent 3-hydroxy acid dehydrogenase YdfG